MAATPLREPQRKVSTGSSKPAPPTSKTRPKKIKTVITSSLNQKSYKSTKIHTNKQDSNT